MSSNDALEAAILQGIDAPTKVDSDDRGPRARADHAHQDLLPSAPNTDDELGSDLPSDDDDGGSGGRLSRTAPSRLSSQTGAANTGPKGVINDHKLQELQARAQRAEMVFQTNRQMEKLSFQAETWDQQQARERREAKLREQKENRDSDYDEDEEAYDGQDGVSAAAIADLRAKERRQEQRIADIRSSSRQNKRFSFHTMLNSGVPGLGDRVNGAAEGGRDRWFGHLREVDERGYVAAIDKEDRNTPVVIHIYSKAVSACAVLTNTLSSLARNYPRTKFLQVQAAAIGFGGASHGLAGGGIEEEDEDDEDGDALSREQRAMDVLPTLLVYKGGQLVANLVRIDLDDAWRGGSEPAIRDLLARYDALITADSRSGRHRFANGNSSSDHDSSDD
ncbi:hypothetical protein ACQY0O_002149 [Thecaphora frezii]